ncbi:protein-disulfide reductase DsbD domain-containing protein [Tropicimonas sp. S265A]|uniref:protein-disulfide reductase DsbD domain-containing protein n=1 Tax=Tropicimonas sp. S265A TaxID=3415134 RepID=UPI003C7E2B08
MNDLTRTFRHVCLGMMLGFAATSASAQFPDIDAVLQVDVLPGWREADGRHIAGLRLQLEDGWKTYWRVPGEGGIPPQFDLSGSENISAMVPHLPKPKVYRDLNMISIGYGGSVVFPLEFRTLDADAPIQLRGHVRLGVCEAICIPVDVPLNVTLAAPGQPSPSISKALKQAPTRISAQPDCQITPIEDGFRLSLSMTVPAKAGEYPVIEPANQAVWVATSKTWREGTELRAQADLYPPENVPYVFDRSALRVTVISETAAYELLGCVAR